MASNPIECTRVREINFLETKHFTEPEKSFEMSRLRNKVPILFWEFLLNNSPQAVLITFLSQSTRPYPTYCRTNSKIAILLFRVSFDIERDVSTNSSRGAEKRLEILSSPLLGEVKTTLNKCYEAFYLRLCSIMKNSEVK